MLPSTLSEQERRRFETLRRTEGLLEAKRIVLKESMKRRALEAQSVTELATIVCEIVDAL